MPNKPDKYGLKFWVLVEVESKYVVAITPYLGKDPSGVVAKNLSTTVVLDLIEKACLVSGYNITGDTYFSSMLLISKLKEKSISYVGTMRNDRRDICPQMTRKKSLNESAYFYSAGVTALSMQCKPNKSVVLFSSMHAGPGTDRDGKPEILDFYNHNKCGVDIVDQMTRIYSTKSASRRWPVAVWCNMLDIAAINSWVIFKKCTNSNVSRRDFLFKFVTQLCHPRIGKEGIVPLICAAILLKSHAHFVTSQLVENALQNVKNLQLQSVKTVLPKVHYIFYVIIAFYPLLSFHHLF